MVSPRNAERSRALAARFANVGVASDNQTVLDRADTVVLAVRPQDIVAALDGLRFRREQMIISFVALLPMVRLQRLVAPAERICRAIPLPSAALRTGPIALWPALPDVAELLGRIGTVVAAPTEELLEPLWATTALMAPFYEQLNQVTGWLATNGVPVEIVCGLHDPAVRRLEPGRDRAHRRLSGAARCVADPWRAQRAGTAPAR